MVGRVEFRSSDGEIDLAGERDDDDGGGDESDLNVDWNVRYGIYRPKPRLFSASMSAMQVKMAMEKIVVAAASL